jgi:acyl dehydratase
MEELHMSLQLYRVSANNTAKASENKIHDDATARRFGFTGGLVGGVHVYAYMTHLPVGHWGRAWLERGTGDCKFAKPVYEGDIAEITAEVTGDGLTLKVNSHGELCATGSAALPPSVSTPPIAEFQSSTPPAHDSRPAADETSLAVGRWLSMNPLAVTADFHAKDLSDARETDPLYAKEGIVHPGTIVRCCNWVLSHNVVLPAWMHVGSKVQNLGIAHIGDTLSAHARVTQNYEHKGHKFVEVDALVLANERTPLARVTHTAIYLPRQLAEAA